MFIRIGKDNRSPLITLSFGLLKNEQSVHFLLLKFFTPSSTKSKPLESISRLLTHRRKKNRVLKGHGRALSGKLGYTVHVVSLQANHKCATGNLTVVSKTSTDNSLPSIITQVASEAWEIAERCQTPTRVKGPTPE